MGTAVACEAPARFANQMVGREAGLRTRLRHLWGCAIHRSGPVPDSHRLPRFSPLRDFAGFDGATRGGTSCLVRVTIASPLVTDAPRPLLDPATLLPTTSQVWVVQGIGADGWEGLSAATRARVLAAEVVIGGERHLSMLPAQVDRPQPDRPRQERRAWPSPMRPALPGMVAEFAGRRVVVLASGDPMLSGIGTTLVGVMGAERLLILPSLSSAALAQARMRWSAEGSVVVTTVGRDASRVLREIAPGRRILVLTSGAHSPGEIGALLTEAGHGDATLTVLGNLDAPEESHTTRRADEWPGVALAQIPALHVLAIEIAAEPTRPGLGWTAGLPDDVFDHDGQLTKRDLRASALARLAPRPGEHLWDVGAGAGSVGIEWMRAHPTCRTTAVESHPDRVARIVGNARRLGVPTLQVVDGRAPQALSALAAPDAIFIGGGATRPGVLDACLNALQPGGRLVVHGVTLETEQLLADAYRTQGGELTRIAVETTDAIGSFTGWAPLRTVTQWAWTRGS